MSGWEYKVVPAPKKGAKGAGVKGAESRFANALEALMNDMGSQGWEYQRAETLPSTERSGLTGSTTEWRNLLVFRRAVVDPIDAFEPELLPAPVTMRPIAMPSVAVVAAQATAAVTAMPDVTAPQDTPQNDTDPDDAPDMHEKTQPAGADATFGTDDEDPGAMTDMPEALKGFISQRNDQKPDS